VDLTDLVFAGVSELDLSISEKQVRHSVGGGRVHILANPEQIEACDRPDLIFADRLEAP
jgi:hypothetical protein